MANFILMKKIGLIGGISWISTVDYYRYINENVNQRLGGMNYAEMIIYSFNYADIKKNNDANDWDKTLEMLTTAALHLQSAGAELLLLGANTMHVIAEPLQKRLSIPLIHIASATADEITRKGLKKVLLLGTKFTMELGFFRDRLAEKGITAIIPADDERTFIQDTIYYELGKGILKPETKQRYLSIINEGIRQGAEGVILGCTEIPMIIKPDDLSIPLFDTVTIHVTAAIDYALTSKS
jgi:aspartate racemase